MNATEELIEVLRGEIARTAERYRAMQPRTFEHAVRLQEAFRDETEPLRKWMVRLYLSLPPKPIILLAGAHPASAVRG